MFTTRNDPLSPWRHAEGGWARSGWAGAGRAWRAVLAWRMGSLSHARPEQVWLVQGARPAPVGPGHACWPPGAGLVGPARPEPRQDGKDSKAWLGMGRRERSPISQACCGIALFFGVASESCKRDHHSRQRVHAQKRRHKQGVCSRAERAPPINGAFFARVCAIASRVLFGIFSESGERLRPKSGRVVHTPVQRTSLKF